MEKFPDQLWKNSQSNCGGFPEELWSKSWRKTEGIFRETSQEFLEEPRKNFCRNYEKITGGVFESKESVGISDGILGETHNKFLDEFRRIAWRISGGFPEELLWIPRCLNSY